MAPRLLFKDNRMPGSGSVVVYLTVYQDAVKAEVEQYLQRRPIGFFKDEISAISAACERSMRSAILAELRRLPKVTVCVEWRPEKCGHEPEVFHRGTVCKCGQCGRRVVLLPGANAKPWLT